MVIEGKLHVKMDTVQVADSFKKRDFVVETAENPLYVQHVSFQLVQDRVAEIDKYKVGDKIEVTFNLRGREWVSPQGETKYFNTLEAWRIQPASAEGSPEPVADDITNEFATKEDALLPF
jgi:hypothetical protein